MIFDLANHLRNNLLEARGCHDETLPAKSRSTPQNMQLSGFASHYVQVGRAREPMSQRSKHSRESTIYRQSNR